MRSTRLILSVLLPFACCCAQQSGGADLILRNGTIVTMERGLPRAEAVAVRGDRILAVGTNQQVDALARKNTRIIDLGGKLAIPGFIEGHGHFTRVGSYKMNLDLRGAKTWNEIVAMVSAAAKEAKPGQWILGRGWHQEKWTMPPSPQVEGFPIHDTLSKVSPKNPVWLTHASGHAGFANALAMQLAGISRATANPPGGDILKDAKGNPTGLLSETAQQLLYKPYNAYEARRSPADRDAEARRAIELAVGDCLSKGITTFEDAGLPFESIDLLKSLALEGKLGLRLYVMIRMPFEDLKKNIARYRLQDVGDHRLTVRSIKRQIDGALGSRGAWLLAPYSDLPSASGLNTEDIGEIKQVAKLAIQNGFQLGIHAIGDRANREVLNIYEETFRRHPGKKDLRWRIEHAQHLDPADIPRFAKLGVIAEMQGIHCTSDAPFVIPRLGPKRAREGAYVWRSLIDAGAVIGNGTDAPVEDVNPIPSFYASVTRKLKDGSAFFPEQRMTREEALKSYTLNNAYAAFEENSKGSLKTGKLADITVLSKNIMTVPDDQIPLTEVVYTIVGGKIAYENKTAAGR